MVDDDYMQVGTVVPLGDGWFLDTESERRFKYTKDGFPVFEDEMNDPDNYGRLEDDDEDYDAN